MYSIVIFQKQYHKNYITEIATSLGKIVFFTINKYHIGTILLIDKSKYNKSKSISILNDITSHLNYINENAFIVESIIYSFYIYKKLCILENKIIFSCLLNLLLLKQTTINFINNIKKQYSCFFYILDIIVDIKNINVQNYILFESLSLSDIDYKYCNILNKISNISDLNKQNQIYLQKNSLQINDFRKNINNIML